MPAPPSSHYFVPPLKPAMNIRVHEKNSELVELVMYNRLELTDAELTDVGVDGTLKGRMRSPNFFNIHIPGSNTVFPHRMARVLARMNQARDEQLALMKAHTDGDFNMSPSHFVAGFSAYLNDIHMIPQLLDSDGFPTTMDIYYCNDGGPSDINKPLFVIDSVYIYGTWWNDVGRHVNCIPDSSAAMVIRDVDEAEEADTADAESEDGDEAEAEDEECINLRNKFKSIPPTLLQTRPDILMVDKMTYAFMASEGVCNVQIVPYINKPWLIRSIIVTVPRRMAVKFVNNIRAHEETFRSETQAAIDIWQDAYEQHKATDPR